MGKRARIKARRDVAAAEGGEAQVGPREPCPCGSGRRYKACHGSGDGASPWVVRPFEGLAGETDLVALREFVPAATAPLRLRDSDRSVWLATLLPGAAPGLVRQDGSIWLGLQVRHGYGDASRDLAAVLTAALAAAPGEVVGLPSDPGPGPRLQDLVDQDALEVTVRDGFDYWVEDIEDPDGSVAAMLEQANGTITPTARLTLVPSAYWVRAGEREYLRWVLPEGEDELLDAFARLHRRAEDRLVEDDRLLGMFRAHGLLVPVWEVPAGTGPEALEEPAEAFADRLAGALAESQPLTTEERAARAGLANRQVTLR